MEYGFFQMRHHWPELASIFDMVKSVLALSLFIPWPGSLPADSFEDILRPVVSVPLRRDEFCWADACVVLRSNGKAWDEGKAQSHRMHVHCWPFAYCVESDIECSNAHKLYVRYTCTVKAHRAYARCMSKVKKPPCFPKVSLHCKKSCQFSVMWRGCTIT